MGKKVRWESWGPGGREGGWERGDDHSTWCVCVCFVGFLSLAPCSFLCELLWEVACEVAGDRRGGVGVGRMGGKREGGWTLLAVGT